MNKSIKDYRSIVASLSKHQACLSRLQPRQGTSLQWALPKNEPPGGCCNNRKGLSKCFGICNTTCSLIVTSSVRVPGIGLVADNWLAQHELNQEQRTITMSANVPGVLAHRGHVGLVVVDGCDCTVRGFKRPMSGWFVEVSLRLTQHLNQLFVGCFNVANQARAVDVGFGIVDFDLSEVWFVLIHHLSVYGNPYSQSTSYCSKRSWMESRQ